MRTCLVGHTRAHNMHTHAYAVRLLVVLAHRVRSMFPHAADVRTQQAEGPTVALE